MTIPDAVKPRRPHRATLVRVAEWLAAMLVLGLAILAMRMSAESNRQLQIDRSAQATAIAKLSTALDQTRQQLQQHGVTPSAPPATTIVKEIPGATGAAGAAGQSITGLPGRDGKDGVSPDPKVVAALVYAMIHPVPGPKGDTGAPGKDSTVPGPQGVPGPASTVAGPKGDKGDKGDTGPPPSSWTWHWTDPAGTTHTYTCTPTSSGSTAYDCPETGTTPPSPSPTSPASPSPSPSGSSTAASKASTNRARAAAPTGAGPR